MKETARPEFLMIRLTPCSRKKILHVWKKKSFSERYFNKMYKKLSCKEKIIEVMHVCGLQIELPFIREQMAEISHDFLERYIKKVMEQYDFTSCYLDRDLYFMRSRIRTSKAWIFKYMLFPEGVRRLFDTYAIPEKEARYVLVDGGNQKIEMVLQCLIPEANYMTIVTRRPEFFQNAVDEVFSETGLLIQVLTHPITETIHGNVVVFLGGSPVSLYSRLEPGAYVIDLGLTDQKLEYILSRRKDLTILYDFEIDFQGEIVEKELAAEVITRDSWKLKQFMEKEGISLAPDELNQLSKEYQMSVKSLKIIQPYKSILD